MGICSYCGFDGDTIICGYCNVEYCHNCSGRCSGCGELLCTNCENECIKCGNKCCCNCIISEMCIICTELTDNEHY